MMILWTARSAGGSGVGVNASTGFTDVAGFLLLVTFFTAALLVRLPGRVNPSLTQKGRSTQANSTLFSTCLSARGERSCECGQRPRERKPKTVDNAVLMEVESLRRATL